MARAQCTAARRIGALLGLSLAAVLPLSAQTSGQLCRTEIGWCDLEAQEEDETCLCKRDGEPVTGIPALGGVENPLTRMETAKPGEFRNIPGAVRLAEAATASRSFAGPGQYPPGDFRAYGLVVFPRKASRFDAQRHLMFCEAYMSALVHESDLSLPHAAQMVTVWPLARDELAAQVDALPPGEACPKAIAGYGLLTAQNALAILRRYRGGSEAYDPRGAGPFLVAWTPGSGITAPETVAIVVDLSEVTEPQDAAQQFSLWRERIQNDPDLWSAVPAKETLIDRIRRFFDRNGQILENLGSF